MESPEVRFDDVVRADIEHRYADIDLDDRYVEVCEPGSLEVCGCVAQAPIGVTAFITEVDGSMKIHVEFLGDIDEPVRVVVRLTGVRKGFAEHRFPDRTAEQFEANERFIQSAYPASDQTEVEGGSLVVDGE